VSRLVTLLNELERRGELLNLDRYIYSEQWADFRGYVAHLLNQQRSLEAVLTETELLLRNTFGYSMLSEKESDRAKSQALLSATRTYAASLTEHPENIALADSTGFSPESVRDAILALGRLPDKLSAGDWEPGSLFAGAGQGVLPDLMGVLMKVPQVRDSVEELMGGGAGDGTRAAEIVIDWVQGKSLRDIADSYFARADGDITRSLTDVCRVIYRHLSLTGTWGMSALSKMPTSGINYDQLPEDQRRRINLIGAMMYHGVSTEGGVLMRMASAPRSVADGLGASFVAQASRDEQTPGGARRFLSAMSETDWSQARPEGVAMSGSDYRDVWRVLSGEGGE
jgi:hypothetical protein